MSMFLGFLVLFVGAVAQTPCPSGTYLQSSQCRDCGFLGGTYTDGPGQTSASACKRCDVVGGTVNSGRNGCNICPTGKYSQTGRVCSTCGSSHFIAGTNNTCRPCAAGKHQPKSGQYSCVNCVAGKYGIVSGGSPLTGLGQTASCLRCGSGNVSTAGATSCTVCSSGFSNPTRTQCCNACGTGSVSATAGSSCCSTCGTGRYKSSSSSCSVCSMGRYQNLAGQGSCKACPGGRFQSNTGTTSCKYCTSGRHNSQTGQSSCKLCPAAKYAITGFWYCVQCPSGRYAGGQGNGACSTCGTGKKVNSGQTGCEDDCIVSTGVVELRESSGRVRSVELGDVQVGDEIRTPSGFEKVFFMADGGYQRVFTITAVGQDGERYSVGLTSDHLVVTENGVIPARKIAAGDRMYVVRDDATNLRALAVVERVETSVSKVVAPAVFSGKVVVNSVVLSIFSGRTYFLRHTLWITKWMPCPVLNGLSQLIKSSVRVLSF